MGVERRIYGSSGKRVSGYEWASKDEYKDLKERELQDMNGRRKVFSAKDFKEIGLQDLNCVSE